MTKFLILASILFAAIGAIITASTASEKKMIVLEEKNFAAITDEVTGQSIQAVLDSISESDRTKPFYIYLDTPGGSVFAGRKLIDFLATTDRDIVCIGNTAISMGFMILENCKTRYVTENAILMAHQIQSESKGSVHQMENDVKTVKLFEKLFDKMVAKTLGLTLEEYQAKLNPEWWIVGSDEILANKAATDVVSVKCSPAIEGKKGIKRLMSLFGPVEVTINLCPLL